MQELQQLNDKLDQLLRKYTALHAENTRLKSAVSKYLKTIELLNQKLDASEQNVVALQMGKNVFDPKEKEDMRKQIDTVISEIDKILNTLDD
jgi:hypothetical protein